MYCINSYAAGNKIREPSIAKFRKWISAQKRIYNSNYNNTFNHLENDKTFDNNIKPRPWKLLTINSYAAIAKFRKWSVKLLIENKILIPPSD